MLAPRIDNKCSDFNALSHADVFCYSRVLYSSVRATLVPVSLSNIKTAQPALQLAVPDLVSACFSRITSSGIILDRKYHLCIVLWYTEKLSETKCG